MVEVGEGAGLDAEKLETQEKLDELKRLERERRLGDPQIEEMNVEKAKRYTRELLNGTTQFFRRNPTDIDIIDMVNKAVKIRKLDKSMKLKIVTNFIKELKVFYGD